MSVASINEFVASWALPGCGAQCLRWQHSPEAHEEYGRILERETLRQRVVRTGPLVVDLDAQIVTVDGQETHLSRIEGAILRTLAERVGHAMTQRDIVLAVWGAEYLDDGPNLLRTTMARLRMRLGQAAGLIVTVFAVGYRLDVIPTGQPAPARRLRECPRLERWSKDWSCCRMCGGVDHPYGDNGYCERCCVRVRRAR